MCEQTPFNYKDGDVVWVKLGPCWWPGEVKDLSTLPDDVLQSFKKPPLAAVKFFQEDTYEYVKNISNIYSYNCKKKNAFIKKGMDLYRAKNSFMDKFPGDVCTAEVKTGGNPNILSSSAFTSEKKTNYAAILFGSTSPKKSPKESTPRISRGRPTLKYHSPSSSVKKNVTPPTKVFVTHRRFLGYDDHEVRVLLQSPDEVAAESEPYSCSTCGFKSDRLDVIVLHNKSHIQGVYSTPTVRKSKKAMRRSKKTMKMSPSKTANIDEDLALLEKGIPLDADVSEEEEDEDDVSDEPSTSSKTKRKHKSVVPVPKQKKTDLRKDLLAEWDDESKSDDETDISANNTVTKTVSLGKSENEVLSEETIKEESNKKGDIKSCFDFEEEDIDVEVALTTSGRKIPRVIPPTEKMPPEDSDQENIAATANDVIKTMEIKDEDKIEDTNDDAMKQNDPDMEVFKDILETTAVPDLPIIPQPLKCEQNFPSAKTIKFPDKTMVSEQNPESVNEEQIKLDLKEVVSEVATKLTNPKKRFVKTFEDSEQNNQRKSLEKEDQKEEQKEEQKGTMSVTTVEVSKLKSQLMTKLTSPEKEMPHKFKSKESSRKKNYVKVQKKKCSDSSDSDVAIEKASSTKQGDSKDKENEKVKSSNKRKFNDEVMTKLDVDTSEVPVRVTRNSRRTRSQEQSPKPTSTDVTSEEEPVVQTKSEMKSAELEIAKESVSVPVKSPPLINTKQNNVKQDSLMIDSPTEIATPIKSPEMIHSAVLTDSNISSIINEVNQNESITVNSESVTEIAGNIVDSNDIEDKDGLLTLATVSELTTNLEQHLNNVKNDKPDVITFESNLTVVTEKDLGDGQVEIANISESDEQTKPVTITNFSMDFSDSDQNSNLEIITEKELPSENLNLGSVKKLENDEVVNQTEGGIVTTVKTEKTVNLVDIKKLEDEQSKVGSEITKITPIETECDIEEQIPSLIVRGKDANLESEVAKITDTALNSPVLTEKFDQSTSSSKLLEILTDAKPKQSKVPVTVQKPISSSNVIIKKDSKPTAITKEVSTSKTYPRFDPKNSKFVIKSATPGKPTTSIISKSTKPIILSDKVIKPVVESNTVSVQKVTSKRNYQDVEDIDTFIIQKPTKKLAVATESVISNSNIGVTPVKKTFAVQRNRGKAKILQQTIITPAGDIIQPGISQTQGGDDNIFDINSMPIVLSDDILTPESIENMPVVLSDSVSVADTKLVIPTSDTKGNLKKPHTQQVKLLNKSVSQSTLKDAVKSGQPALLKTYTPQKLGKNQKLYQTSGSKLLKSNPAVITQPGKPGKFIIVPSGTTPSGSKYTVGKRTPIAKQSPSVVMSGANPIAIAPEPTGNKIMIVTNQQGQQSRVLLTPSQQKLLGYQSSGSKILRGSVKGNVIQKNVASKSTLLSTTPSSVSAKNPNIMSHTIVNSKGQIITTATSQNLVTSDGQLLTPLTPQQMKGLNSTKITKKTAPAQRIIGNVQQQPQQKTIIFKNQHGQMVRRLQGVDDALLDQQVAEQVQAIKATETYLSAVKGHTKGEAGITFKKTIKAPIKRSYIKKPETVLPRTTVKTQNLVTTTTTVSKIASTEVSPPPLAPLSPTKKSECTVTTQSLKTDDVQLSLDQSKIESTQQRPLNQLIIQDALGNQTTITEGQILALPSETVDGQPQSYVLVTLDDTGNLTPLNNEALLSLDPNLGLGGDLSNMVLQIDQGPANETMEDTSAEVEQVKVDDSTSESIDAIPDTSLLESSDALLPDENQQTNLIVPEKEVDQNTDITQQNLSDMDTSNVIDTQKTDSDQQQLDNVQAVSCSINSDSGQQLIITGDPISTQKFIESLTEGNADLANLLANAEGNILIHTDGQQILINTDSDNQMLLQMNSDNMNVAESTEGGGNPIFAAQPTNKNQDILAAALADTDVFQQDQSSSPAQNKISQSQLSPSSSLYPMTVGNVLETTLTLSSPIMTPLEVPSCNSKKIPNDADILTAQVPKNVDLPITITDPNISQTVAQQQVAALIVSELPSNLDLPLTISDTGVSATSTEMNSPSYVYSLPDDTVDINQKSFSGSISMPLLTEEPEDPELTVNKNLDDVEALTKTDDISAEIKTNEPPLDVMEPKSELLSILTNESDISAQSESSLESEPKSVNKVMSSDGSFIAPIEEGLCTLGGEMCSSLSEPPPDMFDLSVVNPKFQSSVDYKQNLLDSSAGGSAIDSPETSETVEVKKIDDIKNDVLLESDISDNKKLDLEDYEKFESFDEESKNGTLFNTVSNSESDSPKANIDENSLEIPVQPQIITDLTSDPQTNSSDFSENSNEFNSLKRSFVDENNEIDNKKCKFD